MTRNNFGFRIDESYSNTLRRNEIRDNIVYNFYFDLWGIIYDQHFIQDIDTSNTVDGKPIYWWMYQSGKRVPTDAGFVVLYRSSNIIIEDLELAKNNHGISFLHTYSSIIENVTIRESETGIALHVSNYNNIRGNRIANNGNGIILEKSSYNNVEGNNIENNGLGIITWEANNNRIYHNNFNNTYQVYNTEAYYSINSWDDSYPSGGNYWSDYVGVDIKSGPAQDLPGSDGIGDTPYIIDADNVDYYPLMIPYAPPPPTYALTITTTVGGTTDPASGTYSYTADSTVQVTAIPDAAYLFDYWELDDVSVGSANPYSVLMDTDHTLKAVFSPIPPPLSASISPLSASINVGQSVTFTSTVSGGYAAYSYQWYLNGTPVSGATSASWIFTPTSRGICYVRLKVTDAKGNAAQSETARITVATVPVGGYSIPIQVPNKTELVLPYIALVAILTAIFTKLRPKNKRKR
jgi:parallel beta-helix repeat protein